MHYTDGIQPYENISKVLSIFRACVTSRIKQATTTIRPIDSVYVFSLLPLLFHRLLQTCWLSPGFVASPIFLFLCVEMLFAIYFNRLILHSIREKKNAKIVAYTKLLLYSVSVSAIPFCFHLLEFLYLVSFIWISQFTYTHTYIPL